MRKNAIALIVFAMFLAVPAIVFGQSAARGRGASPPTLYTLQIQTNVRGAQVSVNGQYRGTAPITLQLQGGFYTIVVSANGYSDFSTGINLDRSMTLNANLQAPNFSFSVTSNVNGADVFLNGRRMGQAPLHIALAPGTYDLRVQAGGYEIFNTQVNVNRNTTIHAQLQGRLAVLHIQIPDQFLNTNSEHGRGDRRRAENDIRVFVDNREVNRDNLRVPQGNHTIRFESGSFIVQQSFFFNGGQDYIVSPELTIRVRQ